MNDEEVPSTPDEEPRLGDGMYPAKALRGPIRHVDDWANEHDPFVRGTTESLIWQSGLFSSQARMLSAPKTSRLDNIMVVVCCGLALLSYTVTLTRIILTIGTGQ